MGVICVFESQPVFQIADLQTHIWSRLLFVVPVVQLRVSVLTRTIGECTLRMAAPRHVLLASITLKKRSLRNRQACLIVFRGLRELRLMKCASYLLENESGSHVWEWLQQYNSAYHDNCAERRGASRLARLVSDRRQPDGDDRAGET